MSTMNRFAICSKPDCDYSTSFDARDLLMYGFMEYHHTHPEDDKLNPIEAMMKRKQSKEIFPFDKSKIESDLPENRFCEKCGSELLFYCPHCKHGLFSIADAKHCNYCSKKIKPGEYDNIKPLMTID